MLTDVDHIDLRVPDLPTFVAFFEQLGLQVVRRLDGERQSVEMALPGAGQVVFEIRAGQSDQVVVDHIAFGTAGVDRGLADLAERGLPVAGTTSKVIAATGRRVANVEDPWGTRWQLAEPAEAEPMSR